MPRLLAFALLLVLAAPLRAQPSDSDLTQAEIDQVREAYTELAKRHTRGKIVLRMR